MLLTLQYGQVQYPKLQKQMQLFDKGKLCDKQHYNEVQQCSKDCPYQVCLVHKTNCRIILTLKVVVFVKIKMLLQKPFTLIVNHIKIFIFVKIISIINFLQYCAAFISISPVMGGYFIL